MDEIRKLQAEFQAAQLEGSALKLSDRNCIELITKLKELGLIRLFHTIDGKEFVTPGQVKREIKDELFVHSGRISLSELSDILNIDITNIEEAVSELVKEDQEISWIQGEIFESYYMDNCAEEINEKLQESGCISLGELCHSFKLPADVLERAAEARLGSIINGYVDPSAKGVIYTEAFVARQKARMRGVFSAITRPVSVLQIVHQYNFQEKLVEPFLKELISTGRLNGILQGGINGNFIPAIYSQTQTNWIKTFFGQNSYIDYDTLGRLEISDGKSYMLSKFKGEGVALESCFVRTSTIDTIDASVEEAVNSGSWIDILQFLPSSCEVSDCSIVLDKCPHMKKIRNSAVVINDSYVVSKVYIEGFMKYFDEIIMKRAKETVQRSAGQLNKASKPASTAEGGSPMDSPDMLSGRKGGKGKKGNRNNAIEEDVDFDDGPKGKRGGKKKGGRGGRGAMAFEDAESPEVESSGKKQGKGKRGKGKKGDVGESNEAKGSGGGGDAASKFLSLSEVADVLEDKNSDNFEREIVEEIASFLLKPLTESFAEAVKSVYSTGSATNKRSHAELQTHITDTWYSIQLFANGIDNLKKFLDDVSGFEKHLLRTLCTDIVSLILRQVAADNHMDVSDDNLDTPLENDERVRIINSVARNTVNQLVKVNDSLRAKSVDAFMGCVEDAAMSCEFMLKKVDKKLERQLIFNHRHALIEKLNAEVEPALVLHLAVVILFQTSTKSMVHAPGKCVPQLIQFLSNENELSCLEDAEVYQKLVEYQKLVMRLLQLQSGNGTGADEDEELDQVKLKLEENLTSIRDIALNSKRLQVS
eukprot:Nk52_evm36s304 gene=Nk52_evmTU36s304